MLKELIKVANQLDSKGLVSEADRLDQIINKVGEQEFEDDEDYVFQGRGRQQVRLGGDEEPSGSDAGGGNVTQVNQQSVNVGGFGGSEAGGSEAGGSETGGSETGDGEARPGRARPGTTGGASGAIHLEPYTDSANFVVYIMLNIEASGDGYIGDLARIPYGPGASEDDGEAIDDVRFSSGDSIREILSKTYWSGQEGQGGQEGREGQEGEGAGGSEQEEEGSDSWWERTKRRFRGSDEEDDSGQAAPPTGNPINESGVQLIALETLEDLLTQDLLTQEEYDRVRLLRDTGATSRRLIQLAQKHLGGMREPAIGTAFVDGEAVYGDAEYMQELEAAKDKFRAEKANAMMAGAPQDREGTRIFSDEPPTGAREGEEKGLGSLWD